MTTIVRVKRHRKEDPVEALVLSCKRKKTEDDADSDSDLFKKILNFSGTVEEKDDKIATSTVQSFTKDYNYSKSIKTHVPEIRSKQRKEWNRRSEDNRFTLLSCLRSDNSLENSEIDVEEKESNVTIVDVSKENNEDTSELNTSDSSYVYDLYSIHYEADSDFNDLYMGDLLSIQAFDMCYRNGEDCYEEQDPDEDDSNDENNWRNDYPDSETDMEENEEDELLSKQLKACHLGCDIYELSSDSGEEEYPNYTDEENYHYYEAEDWGGKSYARYKANAMKYIMDDDKVEDEDDSKEDDSEDEFQDCEISSYHENSD